MKTQIKVDNPFKYVNDKSDLDISWLCEMYPNIPVPNVTYCEFIPNAYGAYLRPGLKYSPVPFINLCGSTNGTLILVKEDSSIHAKSVLAHEYRHHWQYWNGWKLGDHYREKWRKRRHRNLSEEKSFISYFTRNKLEWDALMFQHKHAPCEYTNQLMSYLNDLKREKFGRP